MNCPCSLPKSSVCTMAPPKGHVFRHLPHVPGWHCQFLPLYWIFPVNIQACCLFSYLQPVFINGLLFIFKLCFSVCSLIIFKMYNMMNPLTIKIMTTSVTPEGSLRPPGDLSRPSSSPPSIHIPGWHLCFLTLWPVLHSIWFYVNGILQCVLIFIWLLLLSIIRGLSILCVSIVLFIAEWYSIVKICYNYSFACSFYLNVSNLQLLQMKLCLVVWFISLG